MDLLEAHQKVQQVESGLKLALLVVGGIAGAIALIAFIGAASATAAIKRADEAEQQIEQRFSSGLS